jgi:hypothetical protein
MKWPSSKLEILFFFRNPPSFNQSDIKLRQPDFCKLYSALLTMWGEKKDESTTYAAKQTTTDQLISATFAFGEKNLKGPDKPPFKQCLSPPAAAGTS